MMLLKVGQDVDEMSVNVVGYNQMYIVFSVTTFSEATSLGAGWPYE